MHRGSWWLPALAVVLLAAAALPAWWKKGPEGGDVPVGTQAGERLPDFALTRVGGGTMRLAELRGKVVVLNYWATWCDPCRIEMPHLQRAHAELGGDLAVVGIDLREGEDVVRGYLEKYAISYPVVMDTTGGYWNGLQLAGTPTTFVIDRQGLVCRKFVGILSYPLIEQMVRTARQGCAGTPE